MWLLLLDLLGVITCLSLCSHLFLLSVSKTGLLLFLISSHAACSSNQDPSIPCLLLNPVRPHAGACRHIAHGFQANKKLTKDQEKQLKKDQKVPITFAIPYFCLDPVCLTSPIFIVRDCQSVARRVPFSADFSRLTLIGARKITEAAGQRRKEEGLAHSHATNLIILCLFLSLFLFSVFICL